MMLVIMIEGYRDDGSDYDGRSAVTTIVIWLNIWFDDYGDNDWRFALMMMVVMIGLLWWWWSWLKVCSDDGGHDWRFALMMMVVISVAGSGSVRIRNFWPDPDPIRNRNKHFGSGFGSGFRIRFRIRIRNRIRNKSEKRSLIFRLK